MSPVQGPIPTIIRDLNARLEAERLTLAGELLSEVPRAGPVGDKPADLAGEVPGGLPPKAAAPTFRP